MKKLLLLLLMASAIGFGQDTFTSAATGDWNVAVTWTGQVSDADGIPDADDNVVIGSTHTITIADGITSACNNLQIQGTSGTRLTIGTTAAASLEIYGTLDNNNQAPGANAIDCRNSSGSKVIFKRTSNGGLFSGSGSWASTTAVRYEVNLPGGITGTSGANTKAHCWLITSGTFSLTGTLCADSGSANTGRVVVENGAILSVTAAISRTTTANTPFGSLVINGNSKIIVNGTTGNAFPVVASGFPVYTFSSSAQIEYQGGSQTIGDINYPNLTITAGTKTWAPAGNRTVTGDLNINGGSLLFSNGVTCTVAGNITIAAGAIIGPSSSSNRFVASGGSRVFTLNGTARITRNKTQTASIATNSFDDTFNGFATYNFGASSWLSFRNPTATAVEFWVGPPSTSVPYNHIEFAVTSSSVGAVTYTFKANTSIAGNLAFPSVATTPAAQTYDFGAFTTTVGGAIQLAGDNVNTGGQPTRTYTMGTSTFELNGTSAQNTLGGTNLPSTFYNLTVNNANGVTLGGSITVNNTLAMTSGKLTLGSNNLTAAGSITGANATNYVVTNSTGAVLQTLAAAATKSFPVGTSSAYAPVSITNNDGAASDDYSVSVATDATGSNGGADRVQLAWTVGRTGATVYTPAFQWPATSEGATFTANRATYANLFSGISSSQTAVTGTLSGSDPYTVTATATSNTNTVFGIGQNMAALPVELTSFSAVAKGKNVELNWNTATETNNHGFEVEKNIAGSWNNIGFVEGHGTTNAPQSYKFIDGSASGTVQYRLKQIDRNGTFTYSNVIEIAVAAAVNSYELGQNFPNPFNPTTTIRFSVKQLEHASVKVFDITGREIATLFNDVASPGQTYNVQFNAAGLASGMYFYVLQTPNAREVKKMSLLK